MAGDCFESALHVAPIVQGLVVHGIPLGMGGEVEGKRYWHAWAEAGGVVFDFANGLEVVMDRDRYYRLGKIRDVWHYTPNEAWDLTVAENNYGPWVPGWRTLVDITADDLNGART